MASSPRTGQVRPLPDLEQSSQPLEKKPKLEPKKPNKRSNRRKKHALPEPYSTEDVLWHDIVSVLGKETIDKALEDGDEWESPFEFKQELEVEAVEISSGG